MSKRWLTILLFVSLSFNLAVLCSFLYFRLIFPPPCPPPGPHPPMGREMPPEPGFMRGDAEVERLHTKFNETKLHLMQELAKDPVDEVKVASIIDSSLIAQNQLERTLGEKILAYRKTMTAKEAREHFQSRIENMQSRSHKIQRFRDRRLK